MNYKLAAAIRDLQTADATPVEVVKAATERMGRLERLERDASARLMMATTDRDA